MSDQEQQNQFVRTILDNRKIGLSVKAANGKWASMNFGTNKDGEFTISVWPQDDADAERNKGPIKASLTQVWFQIFLQALRKAVAHRDQSKEFKMFIEAHDYPKMMQNGQFSRGKEVKWESSVIVGRNTDGVIWLAISQYRRDPKVQFLLGSTVYNVLKWGDGAPVSNSEVSEMFAMGLINTLDKLVPIIAKETYKHPAPKPRDGGNGGGYQNRNQGGGGGYQNRNSGGGNNGGGGGSNYSGGASSNAGATTADTADSYGDEDIPY